MKKEKLKKKNSLIIKTNYAFLTVILLEIELPFGEVDVIIYSPGIKLIFNLVTPLSSVILL